MDFVKGPDSQAHLIGNTKGSQKVVKTTVGRSMTTLSVNDHDVSYSKDGDMDGASMQSAINHVRNVEYEASITDGNKYNVPEAWNDISSVEIADPVEE